MSYTRNYGRHPAPRAQSGALVSPRQAAALDKMATVHGFANGSALLADVASCTVAELGRKSRPVVQMFVNQAFARYGKSMPAPECTTAYTVPGDAAYAVTTDAGERVTFYAGNADGARAEAEHSGLIVTGVARL